MILSHGAFQRHAEQLLCFYGELHRQLVQYLFGIAVHDEADGLFCGYASLVAVEELLFADLACCGFMLHYGGVVVDVHIRECVCSAVAAEQQGVARRVVACVVGISNPEGMEGSLLEVDVHITTGSSTHLNNLAKAIQRPGYKIDGTFYGLVPLGDSVLTPEEKDIGAMIIDLGGETMSVGIYMDGILKFSRDIPYGCDLITSDLSRLLHTSRQNAKEIKEKYGVAFPTFLDEEGEIPVPSLDGRSTHNIKKSYILDIIQPRVEELFEQIQHCVATSGYKNYPVVGVLTGGGSQMPGMTDHAVNILGLKEVRRGGVQRDLVTAADEFFDPKYSTALALAIYAADNEGYDEYARESYDKGGSLFGKLGRLFKGLDLFGG